mmetsp:Transcript_30318/g.66339  ORF Transcript_30318/g.66339 Transcript_30318/m.66339 type:complete len:331 (-) Transcript_30318:173-1165(-)
MGALPRAAAPLPTSLVIVLIVAALLPASEAIAARRAPPTQVSPAQAEEAEEAEADALEFAEAQHEVEGVEMEGLSAAAWPPNAGLFAAQGPSDQSAPPPLGLAPDTAAPAPSVAPQAGSSSSSMAPGPAPAPAPAPAPGPAPAYAPAPAPALPLGNGRFGYATDDAGSAPPPNAGVDSRLRDGPASSSARRSNDTDARMSNEEMTSSGRGGNDSGSSATAPPLWADIEEQPCDPPCMTGRGICSNKVCFCREPFAGMSCQKQLPAGLMRFSHAVVIAFSFFAVVIGFIVASLLHVVLNSFVRQFEEKRYGQELGRKETWRPVHHSRSSQR